MYISYHRKKSKKKKAKKSRKESSSSSSDQSAEEDDELGELWVEKTRLDDHVVGPEAPLTHMAQDDKPLEWVSTFVCFYSLGYCCSVHTVVEYHGCLELNCFSFLSLIL